MAAAAGQGPGTGCCRREVPRGDPAPRAVAAAVAVAAPAWRYGSCGRGGSGTRPGTGEGNCETRTAPRQGGPAEERVPREGRRKGWRGGREDPACAHLDLGLGQLGELGQALPGGDVRVGHGGEGPLQLGQLPPAERGPPPLPRPPRTGTGTGARPRGAAPARCPPAARPARPVGEAEQWLGSAGGARGRAHPARLPRARRRPGFYPPWVPPGGLGPPRAGGAVPPPLPSHSQGLPGPIPAPRPRWQSPDSPY